MQPEEKNSGFQLVPGAKCSRKEIHIDCRVLTSLAKLAGFIVAQGESSNFSCHLLHSAHHGYHGRAIVAQVCCGVVRCVSSPVSLRERRHPLPVLLTHTPYLILSPYGVQFLLAGAHSPPFSLATTLPFGARPFPHVMDSSSSIFSHLPFTLNSTFTNRSTYWRVLSHVSFKRLHHILLTYKCNILVLAPEIWT